MLAYVGPANYGDSAGGTSVTNQVIAAGADVIMGMGDGATIGYLQAIETAQTDYPISYIATIGDVTEIVENPDTVLTSVLWNYTDTYVQAIEDIENGTFGTKSYELHRRKRRPDTTADTIAHRRHHQRSGSRNRRHEE